MPLSAIPEWVSEEDRTRMRDILRESVEKTRTLRNWENEHAICSDLVLRVFIPLKVNESAKYKDGYVTLAGGKRLRGYLIYKGYWPFFLEYGDFIKGDKLSKREDYDELFDLMEDTHTESAYKRKKEQMGMSQWEKDIALLNDNKPTE